MNSSPFPSRDVLTRGLLIVLLGGGVAEGAPIVQADVTATLGPDFFLDAAVTGGSDYTVNEPGKANFNRDLGPLNVGTGGTEVTITGIGWACPNAAAANDAATASVTITYLGADGAFGTGDDVVLGTETATWTFSGAGEYAWAFDSAMVAVIDGADSQFRIAVSPLNPPGNGSLRFKTLTGQANAAGTKISVAGTSVVQGTVVTPPTTNTATGSGFWDEIDWDTGSGTASGNLGDGDTAVVGRYRSVTYRNQPGGEIVTTLNLGEDSSNQGQGTLVVTSGTLTVSGNLNVGRGSSPNDSFVHAEGGTLAVGGDANFGRQVEACDGSLIVDGGTVTVAGDLAMGGFDQGGAMLRFHNPGNSPAVSVGGALTLGRCSLDLTFDAGYTHTPGNVIPLVTFSSREGQFLNFRKDQEFNCGPNRFRIEYLANSIRLVALANWTAPPTRPNIVLIFVDDQGYADLRLHGDARYPMPRLESLAASGIRFTDAYVSAGVCHPSRCGLLTGVHQQRFGSDNNLGGTIPSHTGMATAQRTVPRRLQGLGYTTYGVGKWHLGKTVEFHPNCRGFDRWYGMWSGSRSFWNSSSEEQVFQDQMTPDFSGEDGTYLTDRIGDRAVDFIDEHLTSSSDPFYMYVSFTAVHAPMDIDTPPAPNPADPRYARLSSEFGLDASDYLNSPKTFGQSQAVADKNRYDLAAMTLALDENVGKIVDRLSATPGLLENTLIVYLNDNGGAEFAQGFGGNYSYNNPLKGKKGGSMQDGSIRVPCVASWPNGFAGGQVLDAPITSLDWGATFVNASGNAPVAARNGLDGLDLMPLMTSGTPFPAERVLTWRAGGVTGGGSAIRQGDWKLWIDDPEGTERLYNLRTDIDENNNQSGAQPALVDDLRERFLAWEARTLPPLYGSADTVLDANLERHPFAGGLRLKTGSSSPLWLSASRRNALSTGDDFTLGFFLRPSEGAPYPAGAGLWQGLGDSATRGDLIRFGIDYAAGQLVIREGKTGGTASVPVTLTPEGFASLVASYRAADSTLTLRSGDASVSLVLTGSYGPLTTVAMGCSAMEGEVTTLRPVRPGEGAESPGVQVSTIDGPVVLDAHFLSDPPFAPRLERSPDLVLFSDDADALIEPLGGGLYRFTSASSGLDREFFRFNLASP